jgi:spermidine synthase
MNDTKFGVVLTIVVAVALLALSLYCLEPEGVRFFNNWEFSLRKADDATDYETLKEVEDTCRAMIASYESDRLTYEQYKDSDDEEKQSWAEQAKMRANKTASSYNNYVMKNSFVWKDNIPVDIYAELEYIE